MNWPGASIAVVGIGADGWGELGTAARDAIAGCQVLMGSARQLTLVPDDVTATRISWPSPLLPALPDLLREHAAAQICVLASGDPMFYGIGVTLASLVGAQTLRVFPQPSSASLACARLGWPLAEIPVVSAVGRSPANLLPELTDRRRILVLSADAATPAVIADLLSRNGFGASTMTVLEQLGGSAERLVTATASEWESARIDPLNIVAIEAVADATSTRATRLPGLPDTLFGDDGQLTKSEVRALTLSALAPAPDELLWDVGGGSGSIAIEWCRTHPTCRAVSFERVERRRQRIAENAVALGATRIEVRGEVRGALDGSVGPDPDAIFLGGGLTQDGVFETCWSHLRQGGRLVANAVTAESEAMLLGLVAAHGGELRKFQVYRAEPLGGFTAWRPQLPVVQWTVVKGAD
ncbi:precorrin-6y C5,15-methyltransferase (decarboxylating) subunit CbiE [Nocardia cyriacigeorgica]|uniref:Precorrin-6y C5,15-methyltransferase (Decarboxylating) subunit CbiE n=1 Tax=Nocardia cyriacigeorgica TaxID=135487 RepID=A0A6P1D9L4_9NOCA|nr:precorrin-6y C5,15-methyltransferase (decarboxylating) subunit CbiE [Nocardia cyriacigeorgica]NEW37341.1 precorrin-6y C5,15-methyltransferase (decarboxylating) subunit CbiE [Nocardia cyriacigeorgica]NEW46798.1 precorrin-6y C5,15-methyltransferase (decarboxylating) subunit CbiE [Nocardia cyriacigeorgica]NEW57691.1 precorrin-6y C5,15-methyltransferase (decarboxylating) subunit CbiE [Nocardia cyriacigeorgica]